MKMTQALFDALCTELEELIYLSCHNAAEIERLRDLFSTWKAYKNQFKCSDWEIAGILEKYTKEQKELAGRRLQ